MASRPTADRMLLLVAAASVLLLLTAASFRRIWEADFFWQLRTGEVVAQSGPPRVDTLSYASAGRPWIELRWLYCWILHAVVGAAGLPGAAVARWLALLAAFALAVAAGPWRRAGVAVCMVLPLAILASSQRFYVRPELVTLVFFPLYVLLLTRRALLVLPFLQVLWSNLHTLSLLGPGLVGLFLAVEAVRARGDWRPLVRPALVLAATCAATLATPYGLAGVRFALGLPGELRDPVFQRVAAEFLPTLRFGHRYTAVVHFEVLLGLCALAALVTLLRRRRLDPFLALVLVPTIYAALVSIRNLPLFCLAAVPFVVAHSPPTSAWPVPLRRGTLLLSAVLSLYVSWSLVTDRFHVRQNDSNQFGLGLASHRFPVAATRFVKERLRPVRLFHPMLEGSYLAGQHVPTFIDPRLEVHGRAHLERYVRMMDDPAAWKEAVSRERFDAALVDLSSPFLRHLLEGREWRLVYFDAVVAVFTRTGSGLSAAAVDATATRVREVLGRPKQAGLLDRVPSPLPALRVSRFLVRLGRVEAAVPFAEDALAASPRAPGAHEVLGRAAEARDDLQGALAQYRAELTVAPENVLARRQIGLLLFRSGSPESARPLLEQAVARVPEDAEAWAVLTRIHADAGRSVEALRCAERAAALDPGNAAYAFNLGRLYAVAGRTPEGIAALERGLALAPDDASAQRDLAVLLASAGRTDEARAALERAMALQPQDPELRRLREAMVSPR
jgi:Flp pilus assembly protein TadD